MSFSQGRRREMKGVFDAFLENNPIIYEEAKTVLQQKIDGVKDKLVDFKNLTDEINKLEERKSTLRDELKAYFGVHPYCEISEVLTNLVSYPISFTTSENKVICQYHIIENIPDQHIYSVIENTFNECGLCASEQKLSAIIKQGIQEIKTLINRKL